MDRFIVKLHSDFCRVVLKGLYRQDMAMESIVCTEEGTPSPRTGENTPNGGCESGTPLPAFTIQSKASLAGNERDSDPSVVEFILDFRGVPIRNRRTLGCGAALCVFCLVHG